MSTTIYPIPLGEGRVRLFAGHHTEKSSISMAWLMDPAGVIVTRPILIRIAVWVVAGLLAAATSYQSVRLYHELRSPWSLDLALYNQGFWSQVEGDGTMSVSAINTWGNEGGTVWRSTHLDLIRLAVAPIYAIYPDPRTLLVVQNVLIWLIVPAAFALARAESGSDLVALSATALVPLTPLLWPLAWNDFRTMELALPFVLVAIRGWRMRQRWPTILGIAGMLACREEYGVMVASLVLLPPKVPDDIGRTYRWSRNAVLIGVGWVAWVFLGTMFLIYGAGSPRVFVESFGGAKAGLGQTVGTALEFLAYGLGSWSLLALLAPRAMLLSLPWIWGIASGRWSLRYLSDWQWHHVRYTAPIVATIVPAGLIGYARLAAWLLPRRGGRGMLAGVWVALVIGFLAAGVDIAARLDRIPRAFSEQETAEIWRWIEQVGADDGVVSAYEVAAPLSSRRLLYFNRLELQKPPGYPQALGPEIQWAFLLADAPEAPSLVQQGFSPIYRGDSMEIYHRQVAPEPGPEVRR